MTITDTRPADPTEVVVAGMLTENTGKHFLDSGGASGRAWQRNQAAAGDDPVEYFRSLPEVRQGWRGEEWGVVDVFHWLCDRVEYDPVTDARWRRWVDFDHIGADRYHRGRCYNSSGDMETWIDLLIDKGWAEPGEFRGGYTYNHENALSQDVVWNTFTLTDHCPWVDFETEIVAVSIHNGADARGGFTDYRLFTLPNNDGIYDFLDFGAYTITWECDRPFDPNQTALIGEPQTEPHTAYCDVRGDEQWYWPDRATDDEPERIDGHENDDDPHGCFRRCYCGGVMTITGYHEYPVG